MFLVMRAPVCTVDFDLSSINGKTQTIILDSDKTITFIGAPSIECGAATAEYQVTYTPASSTQPLITLLTSPTSTVPTLLFKSSSTNADVNTYTLTLQGRIVGTTTWVNTATATYTYIDLCPSTILTTPTLSTMTTSVLKQSSPGGNPFYEIQTATATNSVSDSQNNVNFCGSYQYLISSAPTTPATALSAS